MHFPDLAPLFLLNVEDLHITFKTHDVYGTHGAPDEGDRLPGFRPAIHAAESSVPPHLADSLVESPWFV